MAFVAVGSFWCSSKPFRHRIREANLLSAIVCECSPTEQTHENNPNLQCLLASHISSCGVRVVASDVSASLFVAVFSWFSLGFSERIFQVSKAFFHFELTKCIPYRSRQACSGVKCFAFSTAFRRRSCSYRLQVSSRLFQGASIAKIGVDIAEKEPSKLSSFLSTQTS